MLTLESLSLDVNDEKGEIGIIKDTSFTVSDGKFVITTGPNSGGKSTTAKLIMGIERPTGGRILSDGQDITDMSITDRANLGISFAFQQPVRFKGVQIIGLLYLAVRKKLTTSEVCQYLVKMGLCARDYINREVSASLSGGELKRVEIAAVVARASKLSVFNEPEVGTDPRGPQNLIQVLECMRQNTNGPILIISHQERILSVVDKTVVIVDDKVVDQGIRDEIVPQIMGTTSAVDVCDKFYETAR